MVARSSVVSGRQRRCNERAIRDARTGFLLLLRGLGLGPHLVRGLVGVMRDDAEPRKVTGAGRAHGVWGGTETTERSAI